MVKKATCNFEIEGTDNKIFKCSHPVYKGSDLCIFHYPDTKDKKIDFDEAFKNITDVLTTKKQKHLNVFYGYIFPKIDLSSKTIEQDLEFYKCEFTDVTFFSGTTFKGLASFIDCKFRAYASFHLSVFFGPVIFSSTVFCNLVDFFEAKFHGPLKFDNASSRILHQLKANNVNFEGAIIEEANLWLIDKIIGNSFRNSYLISISFSGREIINCDFTGAIFDAVNTRGWKPDKDTLKNTKYIYTDYYKKDGKYYARKESRVPAIGNFGEGFNEEFTIKEYLLERYKWSSAIKLPDQIRTAVLNYIQFFTDFIKVTDGIDVEILSRREGSKMRVEFMTNNGAEKDYITKKFHEYIRFADGNDLENLEIIISERSKASGLEKDLMIIELKNQIQIIKNKLEHSKLLLKSEGEKNLLLQELNNIKKDRSLSASLKAGIIEILEEPDDPEPGVGFLSKRPDEPRGNN